MRQGNILIPQYFDCQGEEVTVRNLSREAINSSDASKLKKMKESFLSNYKLQDTGMKVQAQIYLTLC